MRCLCCNALDCNSVFKSHITGRQFIFSKEGNFDCKSKNIIYLITCAECGIQYVGLTVQALHIRLNGHRSSAKRNINTYIYQHYNIPGHNFSNATIQIIDKWDADCPYDIDTLEDYWIATLCTVYPLGLNDRVKGVGNVSNNITNNINAYFTGKIKRRRRGHGRKKKDKRGGNNAAGDGHNSINNTILELNNLFMNDNNNFYRTLRSLNKKSVKFIMLKGISDNLSFSTVLQSYYHNTFVGNKANTITKIRECIVIPFGCKFVDVLAIESILRDTSISSVMPEAIKTKLPLRVLYKYNPPISRKILNYSSFLKDLSKDEISNIISNDCTCSSSEYIYLPHQHIITGDLNFISNRKLRNLMLFGAKYREPTAIEPGEIKNNLFSYIERFMDNKANKYGINIHDFKDWEKKVKTIINNRINFYVRHKPDIFTSDISLFEDESIREYLADLHRHYVITVADKASSNFVIICKKYYTLVLMKEMGVDANNFSCTGNLTYSFVAGSKLDIVYKTVKEMKDNFNLICLEEDQRIPNIFWNPKLHKTPYKARFVAGARKCITKSLSILMNKGLRTIKNSFVAYCKVIRQRTGFNFNWSIDSSLQFLERIKALEIWSLQVFDFSTLYTNLDLYDVEISLAALCDMFFRRKCKYLCINRFKAFFSIKKYDSFSCFEKALFKKAITYILYNTFVTFGRFVFQQTKGIPMGGNCSSLIADLYLCYKEFQYMKRLLADKKFGLARHFSNSSRYVDDVIIINYKNFKNKTNDIYPNDLVLERNGENDKLVNYLDITITIDNQGVSTNLFNKVDNFNFPVVMFTFPSSNIPMSLGYNIFYGQVLRYSKICTKKQDFLIKTKQLYNTLKSRGYKVDQLCKRFAKVFRKDSFLLYKFGYRLIRDARDDFLNILNSE